MQTFNSLPNHPNYYWNQALSAFDSDKIWECDMYLTLYFMSIIGEGPLE
jgi:hypothetical protein